MPGRDKGHAARIAPQNYGDRPDFRL